MGHLEMTGGSGKMDKMKDDQFFPYMCNSFTGPCFVSAGLEELSTCPNMLLAGQRGISHDSYTYLKLFL